MVDQGRGEERSKLTRICEMLTYAPSLTIVHAYLRCSYTSIRLRIPLVHSDRKKPKADLMIVAVAPPVVPKKRESEVLSVLARVRWFGYREECHLRVQVLNACRKRRIHGPPGRDNGPES